METPVPQHHFPDELLLDYVAGNAREALGLPVACHLDLCGSCRHRVTALEAAAAAVLALERRLPGAGRDPVRARLLAGLPARDPAAGVDLAPPPFSVELLGFGLPSPLRRYLGGDAGTAWRTLVPGVRELPLGLNQPGTTGRLVKLRPGVVIPLHDHEGPEYTVVFQGGLEEDGTHFERGDVCVRDQGINHVQCVVGDGPCVALVVNHGELVPLTLKGHLLKLVAGR